MRLKVDNGSKYKYCAWYTKINVFLLYWNTQVSNLSTAFQIQKAADAYFSSKHLMLYDFARQSRSNMDLSRTRPMNEQISEM